MTKFAAFAIIAFTAGGISRAEVPLLWDQVGYVTVSAKVNGQGPFDFVFDTGADGTAVYNSFAQRLKLSARKSTELTGATGTAQADTVEVKTLALDGLTWRGLTASVLPDRPDGATLAGVLGYEQMVGRLTMMDFACGRAALLSLTPSPEKRGAELAGAGAQMIAAGSVAEGKQLTLPVILNGAPGVALLDSGARVTLINRTFANAAGIDADGAAFQDASTRGAVGSAVVRVGPLGTVHFAGIEHASLKARVADLPVFALIGRADQPTMILGLDLLRPTRLILDYTAHRFWLAPSLCAARLGLVGFD